MCGIVCALEIKQNKDVLRPQVLEMSKMVRHRGPDWSGIFSNDNALLAHERLAIVDPKSGNQPIFSQDKNLVLAANGEIYNHRILKDKLNIDYNFTTNSDCEIMLALYKEKGCDFLDDLNGIFAFVIYDIKTNSYLIARDHIGIIPLYIGWDKYGTFFVASELKALEGYCNKIEIFPPGHYMTDSIKKPKRWYKRDWMKYRNISKNNTDIELLRESLEKAVHRQLMSDVPYGVLLSGGLDSSITSALAKKYSRKRVESDDKKNAWYPQLHSFAVGLKGSPDLLAARSVANHIGSIHHEINFTVQEGLDAIKDVIYHLETYDVTTIRASTPMYLMARVIKSMGIKMVLSGEGADEIFGGYHKHIYMYLRSLILRGKIIKYIYEAKSFSKLKKINLVILHKIILDDIVALYSFKLGLKKIDNRLLKYTFKIDKLSDYLIEDFNNLTLPIFLKADDGNSMAHSVETRLPFMDYRIVNFGFSIPENFKINNGWNKYFLRSSLKKINDEIKWRKDKKGFTSPFKEMIFKILNKVDLTEKEFREYSLNLFINNSRA